MGLQGKKIALLIDSMFNEFELIYPYYRLLEAGLEVVVVGPPGGGTFKGKSGLAFAADAGIDAVDPGEFDGVVIPGGYAPDHMRRHGAMVDLVAKLNADGKLVAAICHAGWLLASAGVVEGRKLTSFFAIKDDLVHAGADWVDRDVVVDGNLVTSRTPDDLPAFLKAILEGLS